MRTRSLMLLLLISCVLPGCSRDPLEEQPKDASMSENVEMGSPDQSAGVDANAERGRASLVDLREWEFVGAQEDFFEDRPAEVDCKPGAFRVEGDGANPLFEIDTTGCNYYLGKQPTLVDIRQGDEIVVILWHLDLFAVEPSEGHVVLALGEQRFWEKRIEIPGRAKLYEESWVADADYPAGTTIYFHLHNHGTNNWKLLTVERK